MQETYLDFEKLSDNEPVRMLRVTGRVKNKQYNPERNCWEVHFNDELMFIDSPVFSFYVQLPVTDLQKLYAMVDFKELSEFTFSSCEKGDLPNGMIEFKYKDNNDE